MIVANLDDGLNLLAKDSVLRDLFTTPGLATAAKALARRRVVDSARTIIEIRIWLEEFQHEDDRISKIYLPTSIYFV